MAGDKTDINDAESKPKSGADLSENKHGTVKTEKKDLSGKEAVIDKEVLEVCSQKLDSLVFFCIFRIPVLFFHLPAINISFTGQAFRFFDRNGAGHIRVRLKFLILLIVVVFGRVEDLVLPDQVEDMRLIIHSLGKFLSHRDVKVRIVLLYLLRSPPSRAAHLHKCSFCSV